MHFGENQLSRSLIGLSPLPTGHPPGFQPWWVRSSTRSYPRFNLPMGRSLRFGSTACDYREYRSKLGALFRLAFATAPPHGLTSPHTITRRLILQKAPHHTTPPKRGMRELWRLVGTRFQVLFHAPSPGCFSPFPHGTSPLSVTREYSGLPGGPGRFTRDSTSPVLLGKTFNGGDKVSPTGLSPTTVDHSRPFGYPTTFSLHARSADRTRTFPTTPHTQHPPAITRAWFSLIPFRSPL